MDFSEELKLSEKGGEREGAKRNSMREEEYVNSECVFVSPTSVLFILKSLIHPHLSISTLLFSSQRFEIK